MHHRSSPALFGAIAGLALAAATQPPAQAAPDQTLGMALLSAVVNSDGSLASGAGAEGVEKPSDGLFEVRFQREVTGCTAVASLNSNLLDATSFQARVLNVSGNEVLVRTEKTSDGVTIDVRFSLMVLCAQ